MKAKILTNDPSLIVMFRLGSIEGNLVTDPDEAENTFKASLKEDDLAVLILTTTINSWIEQEVKAHRESENAPLIVVIDG
ncbi:V-type ATP synthase subunit F [Anaerococcus sp. ENR1011]|uniref:V-type ATP synthase subunit F n=1 Tax=Anaerococcus groningensis TaxID=3115616 RepID=A0ABW9N1W9_9FIRM